MKIRLFLIGFLCTFFIGCSKDNPDTAEATGATGTVSFVLTSEADVSRAPLPDGGVPLEEERRVYNYMVLVFDDQGKLEAHLARSPYDPDDNESGPLDGDQPLTFTDDSNQPISLTLRTGSKRAFALVNAPKSVWEDWLAMAQDDTKRIGDYRDYTLKLASFDGIANPKPNLAAGERGFMMTTLGGFQALNIRADDVSFTLTVGRAVAKVTIRSAMAIPPDSDRLLNGRIDNIRFVVANHPHTMYLVPPMGVSGFTYPPFYYDDPVDPENYLYPITNNLPNYYDEWRQVHRQWTIPFFESGE